MPTAPVVLPVSGESAARAREAAGDLGGVIDRRAGDVSSVLGIAGAGASLLPSVPVAATKGILVASIAAGAVDTAIQGVGALAGDDEKTLGTTAYAATGLLPSASLLWVLDLKSGIHSGSEAMHVAALAANVGLVAYEAATRTDDVVGGNEDTSGYLAIGAAVGGLVMRAH